MVAPGVTPALRRQRQQDPSELHTTQASQESTCVASEESLSSGHSTSKTHRHTPALQPSCQEGIFSLFLSSYVTTIADFRNTAHLKGKAFPIQKFFSLLCKSLLLFFPQSNFQPKEDLFSNQTVFICQYVCVSMWGHMHREGVLFHHPF